MQKCGTFLLCFFFTPSGQLFVLFAAYSTPFFPLLSQPLPNCPDALIQHEADVPKAGNILPSGHYGEPGLTCTDCHSLPEWHLPSEAAEAAPQRAGLLLETLFLMNNQPITCFIRWPQPHDLSLLTRIKSTLRG